ncbi:glycosyltransferase family 2 protein [Pantoea sp. BS_4]|uniref:glycosyltransferase family 2 protein n=1 Tax=unclassified Pantoea TaxID=2630326 RepID=UPI0035C026BF
MYNKKFGIIIVFYHPEIENVETARRLSEKYDVVIVDNSEKPQNYTLPSATVINLNGNQGIATALNKGLTYLIEKNYEFAFLLDQDSEPEDDLIVSLIEYIESTDEKTCLVSPSYFDNAINKNAEFIVCEKDRIVRQPAVGNEPIQASYVITSGSMIRLSTIQHIGFMLDKLFIDFVDIEWCLRARHAGYQIVGLPWLKMSHEIGGKPVKVLNRTYVNHSPIRHYYYFRNVFHLLRMKHIHSQWKKMEVIKLAPRFLVYAFFTEKPLQHTSHMLKGIWDGICGRSGKKR